MCDIEHEEGDIVISSIKTKLVFLIAIISMVFIAGFAMLFRNASEMSEEYKAEVMQKVEQRIGIEREKISSYMELMEDKAKDMALAGESFYNIAKASGNTNLDDVNAFVTTFVQEFKNAIGAGLWYDPHVYLPDQKYLGLYAYWDNGKVVFTTEYNTEEYDYPNQEWYTSAIPKSWPRDKPLPQRIHWSEPYFDAAGSMALMVTVSSVMYGADGTIIGMSTADLSMENLSAQVQAIKPTPSSMAFAVETGSGSLTAHSTDQDMVLKPVTELPFGRDLPTPDKLGAGEMVEIEQTIDGRDQIVFYTITNTGMGLGVVVPKDELFAKQQGLADFNTTIAVIVGAAVLGLIILAYFLLNRWVVAPIKSLVDYSRQVACGKLDASCSHKLEAEMAQLHEAMVGMVGSLEEMMGEANTRTEEARRLSDEAAAARDTAEEATRQAQRARQDGLLEAADKLDQVVHVVSSASTELAHQIDESRNGANAQSTRISETATAMEQMSSSIVEIARNAEQSAVTSDATRSSADDGSNQVQSVKSNVDEIASTFQSLYESVSDLNVKAEGIGAIAQTIEDIADQTNLLALNAAIEAARAGDAGRGFAVVADEVRKLAEKTMTATKEVGGSISGIQNGVEHTLGSMDSAKQIIEKSSGEADEAGRLLHEIVRNAMTSSDQIRAIATSSEEQASVTEEIGRSIDDVNAISAKTADAMSEAAQAVSELNEQALALKKLIDELRNEGQI
ncbi:methyl-accepting chemotaxis protein [Oceanidesulfovibrio marinus]|uniref:Methyl-accepting chemotaxis protein n=2 Tax=Oceanidesulfovibrio marinus TaxID=370038 RepID=A0A6P1ZDW7_9BACT|nr:methyl-accepting chemotaxis protein [Oceanidesulfovibrio marinus]